MPAVTHTQQRTPEALTRPPVELEVIIPALNEERRLPATVEATLRFLGERPWDSAVVVVDNDSADRTVDVLDGVARAARGHGRDVALHLIGCSAHGKGAAVRRGIATSSARYVGFMDADGSTPLDALTETMRLLGQARVGAVIASRHCNGARLAAEQPLLRRGGGAVFRAVAHLALPGIADSQCGFKFFDGRLARVLAPRCRVDGFAFDVELLSGVVRAGRRVVELPVVWTDMPGSTFSPGRDGLRSMADLLRIPLRW